MSLIEEKMRSKTSHHWKWTGDSYICLECHKEISEKERDHAQALLGPCIPPPMREIRAKIKNNQQCDEYLAGSS